jgi:hypothetical protein
MLCQRFVLRLWATRGSTAIAQQSKRRIVNHAPTDPRIAVSMTSPPADETSDWQDTIADIGMDDQPIPMPPPEPVDRSAAMSASGLWR